MSNLSGSCHPERDQDRLSNTTLFLRPVEGELKHDEVLSHFSVFGEVNYVRIRSKPKRSYGFVKFSLPESAAKALVVESHIIGGCSVKIAFASGDRHQDGTTLLDLNDDCILAILSMKSLSVNDLLSVAESCRRLKEIASRAFRRAYKTCDLKSLSERDTKTAKRILKHFGSEIRHLRIVGEGYPGVSREMLASLTEYCSTTLQSLDLQFVHIPANCTSELRPLFNNLQKLTLDNCSFVDDSKDLFADCGSLVEINIEDSKDATAFILENITFPKLEHFKCYYGAEFLVSFIPRHMNLKSLKIWNSDVGSPLLQLIACCRRLETLQCWIPIIATFDLSNLVHLRELDICCEHQNATERAPGLENLQFLEHLTLHSTEIDSEFVRTLTQLQRLRALEFSLCTGLENLNQIGKLGQLTTLKISSNEFVFFDFDLIQRLSKLNYLNIRVPGVELKLATYLRIVDVVRRRPDSLKLTFRLASFAGVNYDRLLADFARNAHLVEMIIYIANF